MVEESVEILEARRRARKLLLSWLSPSQRTQFKRDETFVAIGSVSGKRYTLKLSGIYNVNTGDWMLGERGKYVEYCTMLPLAPPHGRTRYYDVLEDRMLAQKIAIETDEGGFLSRANTRDIWDSAAWGQVRDYSSVWGQMR
jgi:hypothetical protein